MSYTLPFIDNVFRTFKEKNIVDQNNAADDNDDEPVIPPYFFQINKRFILLKLPFCQNNEIKSKHFLKKLLKPSLNEQKNFERLILFRNGIP